MGTLFLFILERKKSFPTIPPPKIYHFIPKIHILPYILAIVKHCEAKMTIFGHSIEVKMSILGGGMVENLIFIHFGTKEIIPDHSPAQNQHFTLYFGYRGAKCSYWDSIVNSIEKKPFGEILGSVKV